MRGGYGPIGQQLMQARGQMRRPGVMEPPEMDEDMEYPGGGDMGMEMSEPYERNLPEMQPQGQPRAMPVHDTGQMQAEYRRMGMKVPGGMERITNAYQSQQPGPIREQLHSAQHQMMLNDQNTVNQTKRMELGAKKSMIQQKILGLQRAGRLDDAARLQRQFDVLMNSLDQGAGALPE
ncbi:MAG: hypothetical protein CV089_18235 [Nitrospira sp. WS110]|nr:hypothetical protein [Nitrospira sp. WS110]